MARKITGTLYKRGEIWWMKYTVNGKAVYQTLDTKDKDKALLKRDNLLAPLHVSGEAEKAKALATAAGGLEAQLAVVMEATRPRLPLTAAWAKYLAARNRPQSGPHTLADYERHWSRFVEWMTARRPGPPAPAPTIEDVTTDDTTEFMTYLEGLGLGPNRFNKTLQALRLVYRILAPFAGGMANPFDGLTPKLLEPEHHRELSEAELKTICTTATGELRTLFAVGLFTGLRIADASQLQWPEVDLRAGVIVRVPSKTRRRVKKAVAVPIHPDLRAILEETPIAGRRGPVLPELCALYKLDAGARVAKRIRDHFAACGIDDVNTRARTKARIEAGGAARVTGTATFHSLRHSLVSALARRGVPLAAVRELVGHSSEAIQRVYLHNTPDDMRKAIGALPSMTEPVAVPELTAGEVKALRAHVIASAKGADVATLKRLQVALTTGG